MTFDVMSNSPFFTNKYKEIWKENPVVNQTSLRAFCTHPFKCLWLWMAHPQTSMARMEYGLHLEKFGLNVS